MATVSVRYIVDDIDAAIAFYPDLLGFELEMHPNGWFAMLSRGDLRLVLNRPGGGPGGGSGLPDGTLPQGGWRRLSAAQLRARRWVNPGPRSPHRGRNVPYRYDSLT